MNIKKHFEYNPVLDLTAANIGINRWDWVSVDSEDEEGAKGIMRLNKFDILPIVGSDGRVDKFFSTRVWKRYEALNCTSISTENSIYYRLSLNDLISKFREQESHFYFLTNYKEVLGLVSYANLNCQAVYNYLYQVLADIERSVASVLEASVEQSVVIEYFKNSPDSHLREVLETFEEEIKSDAEISIFELFYLQTVGIVLKKFNNKLPFHLKKLNKYSSKFSDQGTYGKRKRYEPQTYAKLLSELTQLTEDVPKLTPDRNVWDIEGNWASTGAIYLVDAAHQARFEEIHSFDCRTIKLVNFGKPAARITFYQKHRYWLLKDKDMPLNQKADQIKGYVHGLAIEVETLEAKLDKMGLTKRKETLSIIGEHREEIKKWRAIFDNLTNYEMAVSNYSRQYFYITVNYKYRLPSGEYTNEQEHLLNPQRDRAGNITQPRYNIIFVDPYEILRDHPYQNREVEGFLENFPVKTTTGRNTIYARLRPENDSIQKFQ